MADGSDPAIDGSLRCGSCGRSGVLSAEGIALRCNCGGEFRYTPPPPHPAADPLVVPGTPALVDDVICRFRVGDIVTIEHAVSGYSRGAEWARPDAQGAIQAAVESLGGEMRGLEFALKALDGIRRKVTERLEDGRALRLGTAVTDALRFTAVFEFEGYSQNVQSLLWELQDRGGQIIAEENSWGHHDDYSGLHYVLMNPPGLYYELQLHTYDSFRIKQDVVHPLYEEFRDPRTSPERRDELWTAMCEIWERVPIPEGVEGFAGPDAVVIYRLPE